MYISLATGKFERNFSYAIFKQILVIDGWGISCEIALILMSLDLTGDQLTFVNIFGASKLYIYWSAITRLPWMFLCPWTFFLKDWIGIVSLAIILSNIYIYSQIGQPTGMFESLHLIALAL